jgi:uncharacterized protein (DUF362 family)
LKKTQVSLVKTANRPVGVSKSIALLQPDGIFGKDVLIKPNFNTADATPGSTHNDTLRQLILEIQKLGARSVTIGERSYHLTEKVIRDKGVDRLADELGVSIINFDHLPPEDWVLVNPEFSHWREGFRVARPILEADCVVSTACLKTHRHGGVFTMSLKLSVGVVPIRGYPYMDELHSSHHQRKMIAELNQAYRPALVLLDGVEAFVDGGPDKGVRKAGNIMVAGNDRVAIDAVGVAILKELGSNPDIMDRRIFDQEQIARAAEIGIGISSPEQIELRTGDPDSEEYAERLRLILANG